MYFVMNEFALRLRKTLAKPIPLSVFIASVALLSSVLLWQIFSKPGEQGPPETKKIPEVKLLRTSEYELTRPVLFAEISDESAEFMQLKCQLSLMITEKKKDGSIHFADIFLRRLDDGKWMNCGDDKPFPAGSLLKVPIMMAWLKMAENDPGLLERRIFFAQPPGIIPGQTYGGRSIIPGREYAVSELLEYLIEESDNTATWLLAQQMDLPVFQQLFTDLGLEKPDRSSGNYALSAHDFSKFMVVLYNSSYLTPKYSQYALKLLTKCTFNKGMTRKLPAGVMVAHKFGEQSEFPDSDLSESGIVYSKDKAYLVTIMTHGENMDRLSDLISNLSQEIYQSFNP
jgi:beta-lactamase class A